MENFIDKIIRAFVEKTVNENNIGGFGLTPREEAVIRKRYSIGEKRDYTLEEVAKMFNVTRERIRQIEDKALDKMFLNRNEDNT